MEGHFTRRFVAVLALAALLAGCGPESAGLAPETDDALYREGIQLSKEGRNQEALADYLKVIARRGDNAPESHLSAGLIYLRDVRDPIAAIYHFRKFLEYAPNAPQAVNVRGLVDTAKRDFARTLPGDPLANPASGDATLIGRLDRLERENEELRAELAAARGLPPPVGASSAVAAAGEPAGPASPLYAPSKPAAAPAGEPVPAAVPVQEPAAVPAPGPVSPQAGAGVRQYTVVSKDTLFGIAKKCYGSATNARVRAILEANRGVLSSARDLKPGMQLRIP